MPDTATTTPHADCKRFDTSDLRHARRAYGRVIADAAPEETVRNALLAATLVTSNRQSSAWRQAYYGYLFNIAPDEIKALATQAFNDSLAESDAGRMAATDAHADMDF